MPSVRFYPLKAFKYWEGDKVLAHYSPELSYAFTEGKPKHDRGFVLLFGGTMPPGQTVSYESRVLEPGDEAPGWINEGLVSLEAPAAADGVSSGLSGSGTVATK